MERFICFIIGLILVLIPCLTEVGHKKEKSEIVYVNTNFNKVICENEKTYEVPKEKVDTNFYKVGEPFEYDTFSWIAFVFFIIGGILMVLPFGEHGGLDLLGDLLEGFSHH